MKLKLFKKSFSVFAAALLLATAIPVTEAAAAVTPTAMKIVNAAGRKKSRHTLALGEVKSIKSVGSATANVRFAPSNAEKSLRLTSDDSSVVQVKAKNSAGTDWTFTGVGTGEAVISIRSAVKSSLKSNFLVYVTSKSPSYLKLSKSALTMNLNSKATIGAMNSGANVNVTFNSTKVDRFISVSSSDSSVVSVTKTDNKNYSITALKAGTATLSVASATDPDVEESLTVTVKSGETAGAFSAKQTKKNQVYVSLPTAMTSAPGTSLFRLRQTGQIWDVALSGVTLAADGKGVYLNTMIDLLKNTQYELTYSPTGAAAQSTTFTTSENKPVQIQLKTQTVVANIPRKLSYSLIDANGVELIDVDESRVEITVSTNNGYYDNYNKQLTLFSSGTTAAVKLVYHTYEYVNGVEQVVVGQGNVTALATSNVTINLEKAVVKSGSGALTDTQWNSTGMSTLIPANSTNPNLYLAVRVKSSEGNYYASDAATNNNMIFKFESKNTDVANINQNSGQISITPGAAAGRQAIIVVSVTFENRTFSYTVPITIAQESIPQRLEINPSYKPFGVSSSQQTQEFSIKVFDQYGINISSDSLSKVTLDKIVNVGDGNSVNALSGLSYDPASSALKTTITVIPNPVRGSYTFQIKSLTQYNRILGSFTIVVQ